MTRVKAYQNGAAAFYAGAPLAANPFGPLLELFSLWADGWRHARAARALAQMTELA